MGNNHWLGRIVGAACFGLTLVLAGAARAGQRPTIWIDDVPVPGETVKLKIQNPLDAPGTLLLASAGRWAALPLPKASYQELDCNVPNYPGALFTTQFFSWDGGYVGSNVLAVTIEDPGGGGSFRQLMDVKPMAASDDVSGYASNVLVVVPVYLAESDDIQVNAEGFCNLKATTVGSGPRIVAQQFNVLQVYHRDDPQRRRAMLAHGQLVVENIHGEKNQTFQIVVEAAKDFPGSQAPIATAVDDKIFVDTGAARFTLVVSPVDGFRVASVNVAGREVLRDGGANGTVFMDRRRLDGSGVDRLYSTNAFSFPEITKNGQSCAEVLIRGELRPPNDHAALPQKYRLLLRFHTGSAKMNAELMLTNWDYEIGGVPANYVIPYESFGFTVQLAKKTGAASTVSYLRDSEQLADFDLVKSGDSASVLLGYKTPRWSEEYYGLGEKLYWPENQRVDPNYGGTDLRTKGYWLLANGRPDPRFESRLGNPDIYPRSCAAQITAGDSQVAVVAGPLAEYVQPIGLLAAQQSDALRLDVNLTDWLATNDGGKSIPWRSCVRKSFAVDFNRDVNVALVEFIRNEQFPYVGLYSDVASYDGRCRNFSFISVDDRNTEWKRTGFLKPDDYFSYYNPRRVDLNYPYFIGANHTGGFNNWDQQFLQFLLGIHGAAGFLMELRWNVTFHSMLGVRQFDDSHFPDGPQNPGQASSQKWEIDIEHEDHKGYHLGAAFFGNPLDVEALARQAYFTLGMSDVGKTLWVRAIGNRIGRISEEQGFLRSLFRPQRIKGSRVNVEDEILPHALSFWEDFDSRRLDTNDPCNSSGWSVDPDFLPAFKGDPEDIDFPTASRNGAKRYPWVCKTGYAKVIDAFHLTKGLASVKEFMPPPEDFPADFRERVGNMIYNARLRMAQGGMTFAQWYAFLSPYCSNFDPACDSHQHYAPWERNQHQRKYYSICLDICDDRTMDEDNNWMAYSFMDAYCEAAEQYLDRGDVTSAFYMLRYALNHISSVRFKSPPSTPCGDPPDVRQNDFFWSSIYPGELRLWKLLRDWHFDDLLSSSYPNLFPVEKKLGQ
jgi:hypothetical protein